MSNVATALSIVASAVFALRDILFHTGTPAYLHDWYWPLTNVQLADSLSANTSAWELSGTGRPNPFPLLHPIFFLWRWLAVSAGAAITLKLTLLCVLIAYGLGIYACARFWLGATPWSSRLMAAVALLGPTTFTKLLAGHIYYLIALSAFVWSVALLARASEQRWWLALGSGLLVAVAALQPQVWIVASAVMVILCIARLQTLKVAAASYLCCFMLIAPELWSLYATPPAQFAFLRATTHWELNNSSPLASAPVGMGYFAGYADHAYSLLPLSVLLRALLWVVPLTALAGVIKSRAIAARIFFVIWLLLVALSAGLWGPLSNLLSFVFLHWEAASTFRELYHFAPLAWSFACMLGASGLDVVRIIPARNMIVAAALLTTCALWLPPNFAGQLQTWPTDPRFQATVEAIAHAPGQWRVLFLPAQWPVGPQIGHTGGVDPAAYGIGDHTAANSYTLNAAQRIAFAFQKNKSPRALTWLAALGVGAEVRQAGIVSRFKQTLEPPKTWPRALAVPREDAPPTQTGSVIWGTPMAFATNDMEIVRSPLQWNAGPAFVLARDALGPSLSDPYRVPLGHRYLPTIVLDGVDPSRGWVNIDLWEWLDPRLAALGSGLISWSREPLELPHMAGPKLVAHILMLGGKLFADRRQVNVPDGKPTWVVLPATSRVLSVRNGVAAVGEFVTLSHLRYEPLPDFTSARITALKFDPEALTSNGLIPADTKWIVLKQTFSDGWHLTLGAGRVLNHVQANDYANAWEVQVPKATGVSLVYVPAATITMLERAGLCVWLLACLTALLGAVLGGRRTRVEGPRVMSGLVS